MGILSDPSIIIKETLTKKGNVYHAEGRMRRGLWNEKKETTHFIGSKKDLLDILQNIVPENTLGIDPLTDLKFILKYFDPNIKFKHRKLETR